MQSTSTFNSLGFITNMLVPSREGSAKRSRLPQPLKQPNSTGDGDENIKKVLNELPEKSRKPVLDDIKVKVKEKADE